MIARLYGREGMPNHRKIKVRLDGEAGRASAVVRQWPRPGIARLRPGRSREGNLGRHGGGDARLHRQSITVARSRAWLAITSDMGPPAERFHRRSCRAPARHSQFGCNDRGRGRGEVRLRMHGARPRAHPGAGRERDRQWHDRRRTLHLRPEKEVPAKLHGKSVTVIECSHVDYEWMHPLLHQFFARTGSRQAEYILKNWAEIRRGRRLRKVLPLAVARAMEDLKTAGRNAGRSFRAPERGTEPVPGNAS